MTTALACPEATRLLDVDAITRLLHGDLPDVANRSAAKLYRLKLLRAISVAHFIARATAANRPGNL